MAIKATQPCPEMTKMQVMLYLVFYQLRKVNLGRMNSVISTSLIDSFIQSRAMQQWRDWLPHTGVHHSLHGILKCLHHATHLQTQQNYKSDSTGKMSFSEKKKKLANAFIKNTASKYCLSLKPDYHVCSFSGVITFSWTEVQDFSP